MYFVTKVVASILVFLSLPYSVGGALQNPPVSASHLQNILQCCSPYAADQHCTKPCTDVLIRVFH